MGFVVGVEYRFNLDAKKFADALNSAKKAVESNPKSTQAQRQLGFTYFPRQEFAQALKHFNLSNSPVTADLIRLAEYYSAYESPLKGAETFKLLQSLSKRAKLQSYILQYDSKIKSADQHLTLVMLFLAYKNKITRFKYEYNTENKTLNLSETGELKNLHHTSSGINTDFNNLLKTIPLKVLILPKTQEMLVQQDKLSKELRYKILFE